MNLMGEFTINIRKRLISALVLMIASVASAEAATATYVAPANLDASSVTALSTSGDSAGASLGLGDTLALVFDSPFATAPGDNVSVFTLRPDVGAARFRIRFGVFNNGAPTFVFSRNRRAGARLSVNNLFQRGCSAFGGCDYIEITLTRTRRGATGAEVDYVSVDGEVTEVASPTPGPGAWAMMIVSFAGTGWRLKALRRRRVLPHRAGWRYAATGTTPR